MLRLIGYLFRLLAGAFIAIGVGLLFLALLPVIRENQPFKSDPLGKMLFDYGIDLALFQAAVQRHIAPWLWSDIIQPVLQAPIFVVFLILGLALWLLTGRRRDRKNLEPKDRKW